MSERLKDKVALVTGGESGIGAATVARFRAEGAITVSADRVVAAAHLPPDGAEAKHPLDVAEEASVQALVAAVLKAYGRLDVVVNCAGVGADRSALDTTVEQFDRIIAINLRGSFLIARESAKAMMATGGGSIVLIGSVSGRRGNAGRVAYGASKGGVVTMAEVMAVEWAERGVRVNVVAPGPIDSPMAQAFHPPAARAAWNRIVPMARYGRSEEIAGAALYLASADSSYVTGHVLHVDGGFMAGGLMPDR
jgi:NAD(P)-dependent dehydrogenase (short-subunit alcohol dehydrogenase family)